MYFLHRKVYLRTSKKGEKLAKIQDLLKVNSSFIKNINFIQEGSIPSLLNNELFREKD